MSVERNYRYFHRPEVGTGWWCAATKEEWLTAILTGHSTPKPPASWVKQQALEGRSEKAAAIIWGHNYPLQRKYVIWSEATEEDFRKLDYL